MKTPLCGLALGAGLVLTSLASLAGANPAIPFYGGGTIVATPHYPIVGEATRIDVTVGNPGDAAATHVQVRISFNDWGVTFNGWQEIGTVTLDTIPAGGTATATVEHVFLSPTHTCVEAIIVAADEDTEPSDNRGQINLEVLHAGDTFSYDVPIRNEGDAPIQVAIRGGCAGRDAAGQPDERCQGIKEEAELAPGEEVRVPVEMDLRGLPPGAVLEYLVEAVDTEGHRNHIVLRVIHTSARDLKAEALELASDLAASVSSRPLRQRLETVARHLDKALQIRRWHGKNHVIPNGGAAVFAQEQAAINQARALLDDRLPLEVKATLQEIVLKLVDADRILAQTALAEAEDIDEDQAIEAAGQLADGDADREAGAYTRAIEHYRRAWHLANR